MQKNKTEQDFMIHGPIMKVILTISAPLMLNNLVRTLYTVTDGLYVAQLSAEDFAATAFTWPLNFLFISIGMGIGVAATALIAQHIGAKQNNFVRSYIDNTLLITSLAGLTIAFFGYLLTPWMLRLMGGQGQFLEKAIIYLQINFIGIIFDFGFFGYQAILNAQGKTKTITLISAISMFLNIILDPFFIYQKVPVIGLAGLGMGIAGAAWATIIAKIVLYLLAISAVHRQTPIPMKFLNWQYQPAISWHILKVALPSSMGYSGAALGFTVMNSLIQSYGTNTLAAFSMVNRISDLLMQPQLGIGMALTSIIGQNMGARQYDRSFLIFKRAIQFIMLMSVIASALVLIFKDQVLGIFIAGQADPDLWLQAKEYVDYTAFIIFFMGLFSAFNGFFQGCGQTKYAMYMSVGRLWFIRLPLIMIMSYFTDLGSTGIWIAMLLSNMLIVLYGYYIYRTRNWTSLIQSRS
ncbi:MATE family efflux transporter [Ignavigranum ruoffiae]|uniref:MATE family efflux transporter n=1 Tax=Ignavigranum ruoffiae TaxID=89093 RepID=UPI0024ADEA2D|nr:MATE family efflux transporter [Ignavigranum ruoffiae]